MTTVRRRQTDATTFAVSRVPVVYFEFLMYRYFSMGQPVTKLLASKSFIPPVLKAQSP
jgi:hypothetical protein